MGGWHPLPPYSPDVCLFPTIKNNLKVKCFDDVETVKTALKEHWMILKLQSSREA